MKLFGNYEKLRSFIDKNYRTNPAYAIGGIANVQTEYREFINAWDSWYRGHVTDFHDFMIYNGDTFVNKTKRSLQMAKKVCEDRADLLLNEQIKITVADKKAQILVDSVLNSQDNSFRSRSNELIEKMCALGTAAFVEFRDRDKILIDYISTENIIPITIENGRVIDCAFASSSRHGDDETIYMNVHVRLYPLNDISTEDEVTARFDMGIPAEYDGYLIANHLLKMKEGSFVEQGLPLDLVGFYLTNSPEPRFQLIKPAKANNITYSEMGLGMSLFSNALDQLCGVDEVYNSYVTEFENGISKMFVHDDLAQINISQEGETAVFKPLFDKRDTTFYAADLGEGTDKIKFIQSDLRVEPHETGINRMLNLLGFKCGFGNNYYKFEGGVVKTATEIISENNPLYRSIKKDQHILREALQGLARNILILSNEFDKTTFDVEQSITVEFDDSIFEDTDSVRKSAILEYNSGLLDGVGYLMRVYKLTEDQAIIEWAKRQARMPVESNIDDMGGGA